MDEKLTRLETIYLGVWAVMGTGIIAIPFVVGQFTTRDGWLSVTAILLTGSILVFMALLHRGTFGNRSVVEALNLAFGRLLGGALSLWYALCLYLVVTTVWRELVLFLGTTAYPETPLSLLAAVLVFPVSYGISKGIKSVGLFSDFVAPLAVGVIIAFVLLSLSNMHFASMRPVLSDGWTPVLRGAIVPGITYILEPLVLLQIMRDLNTGKFLPLDFGVTVVLVFGFVFILVVVCSGVLGEAVSELRYPVLEVVRSIKISQFVERLDTLYVMGVLASLYIKLTLFQYAFCKALQELFGLSSYKLVAWPATLLSWAGSIFLFSDGQAVGEFIMFSTPAYFIFTFILIPGSAAVFYKMFRKGKSS